MLDPQRWQRISRLLDEWLELDAADQAPWLERLHASHPELADDVAGLLAQHDAARRSRFLEGTAALPDAVATLQGRRLGAYVLETQIGQGGMGSVWRAHRADGKYEATVAVKLLNTALIGTAGAARFRREGSLLARLQHPNIAHLLDAGVTDDGQPYLVLELVDGEAIDAYCDRHRLDVVHRIHLFIEVLAAVAHAHAHLAVHRDLKPSNVLVMRDGQVKLLDFGIAKLLETEPGSASAETPESLGAETTRALTPRYAAPEQWQGGPITTATDVYALGIMLYQLLSGRHPSGDEPADAANIIRATLDADAPRLSQAHQTQPRPGAEELSRIAAERATTVAGLQRRLAGDLDNIVALALRKAPAQRYPSVAAFADDLRRHLANEPVSARPDALGYRAAKFVRRHRGAVLSASLTLLALIVAVVFSTWQMIEARSQREEARAQAAKAEASRRFLNLVLTEVGADGAALTPVQLLDRGAHLLDAQYAGDPKFMVDQLLQLSDGYDEVEQTGKTHEVLLRAESIARALDDDDERRAEVACNLAGNELALGNRTQARAQQDSAHRLLAKIARPPPALRADCLQADALLDNADNRPRDAIAKLMAVLGMLESTGNTDHPSYAAALSRLTRLHNDLGEPILSYEFNRRAGAALDKAGRGGSMSKIVTLNNEAAALFTFGEIAHAAQVQAELLRRVDARGANPDTKVSFTTNYGGILTALGRPDEAIAVLRAAIAQAAANHNAFWERHANLQLARALVRSGRWREGEPLLDRLEADYRRDEVMNKSYLRSVASVRAESLLLQGRPADAKAVMDRLLLDLGYPQRVEALPLVNALQLAAEIELARGDPAAAEPLAASAVMLAGKFARDPGQSADIGKAWLELGRVRARRDDRAGAREALTHSRSGLEHGLGADNALTLEARRRLAALDAAAPR